MGAFLLFKKPALLCVNDARLIFGKKGFSAPSEFDLGRWTLLQYGKILPSPKNHITGADGTSLHACGTVVYRGLGYRDSLHRLLTDFRDGQVDQEQLLGGFCLLYWDGRSISILMDRSRTFHVFGNEERTCLSSSFLAVLSASPIARPLNRLAACEKLATGYIVGPDTMVAGIQQVDGDVGATYRTEEDGARFVPVRARPPIAVQREGMADSIARQISRLQTHFRAMDALHVESHGELGLSSGYDSRLVLACARFLSRPMDLHTHGTQGIHDAEMDIVRQIASRRELALSQVFTRRIEDHGVEEIAAILDDGLHFYDGRCSHNMGAFGEVYTRAYKARVLGAHRLGWNGLGGEIYRNYYFTADRSVNLRHWLDRHIYYPFASEAWGNVEEYEAMHRHRVAKMAHRLGTSVPERAGFFWLRRYYSEIRMPDCDAANNDALNQLAFFHTPFMDAALVAEALHATPHIGFGGAYQSRLIRELDPHLAAFPTHYGYALDSIPLRPRLHAWWKCQVPEFVQRIRLRTILRRMEPRIVPGFLTFIKKVPVLEEIRAVLCSSVLRGRFEDAMIDYAQRPTTVFVGSFLRAFQHKIRW